MTGLERQAVVDCALQCVKDGWSVLPVRPDEKRPYMNNWLKYTDERADEKAVKEWYKHLAGAGLGVVTGKVSGIVVLDVESDCPRGIEDILTDYPTGKIARTGSGGYHLFFKYPDSEKHIQNRVRMAEGMDLRADGGFIVLPPTKHPSGNYYEWAEQGSMGDFPDELLKLSRNKTSSSTGGDKWIADLLHGVGKGSRDDSAARLAGYFFKNGMPVDIVEALLIDWNERNDPPLDLQDIRRIVGSVNRYYVDKPKRQQYTGIEFEDDRVGAPAQGVEPDEFGLVKVADYIHDYGGTTKWAVEDWLPAESVTFLVSPPESYKTWLLLDLAVSVAADRPFLGQFKVFEPGPALIIQQEDNHAGLTERIALILQSRYGTFPNIGNNGEVTIPLMPDVPIYIHPDRKLKFDNPDILQKLEKQIVKIRPKMIIIDPLYSAASVDNYMSAAAEQMMVLKTWRDKYGCSFIIAHHSKKNVDPNSTAREDSWGSQFLNAFLEAGWQIRRNSKLADNEVVVRRHSKTQGNLSPVSLTFDISTEYPMKYAVNIKDYIPSGITGAPSTLFELIQENPVSQTELASMTGKSKSTLSRQLKQLVTAGSIQRMPDGKYKAAEIDVEGD